MPHLQIGPIQAEPGEKTYGYGAISIGEVQVHLPLVLINGSLDGPRLALTAGIHPKEFLTIEALRRLLSEIDPAQLCGQVVACPLVSYPALQGDHLVISPVEAVNLNRIFPGDPTGNPSERVTAWLFDNLIRPADVFIDLHSGGPSESLLPHVAYRTSGNPEQDRQALALAEAFGIPDVIRGKTADGGNSHAAATRAGIVALLVEAGEYGQSPPALLAQICAGMQRVMETLGMLNPSLPAPDQPPRHWTWEAFVEAGQDGLWYPECEIGADVQEGMALGRILDPLGSLLSIPAAPVSGRIMYGERGLVVSKTDVLAAIARREA
jgi:predicted deacylase